MDLPRRGTVVSTLTFSDTRDVYAVREGLEIVAARQAIERATDAELTDLGVQVAAMEEAWDRRAEYGESLAADLAFHRTVVSLSGNERLLPFYEQMLSQTQLLVRMAAMANPRLRLALRRSAHRDILDALLRRDVDAARRAIADHYTYAEQRLFSGVGDEGDEAPEASPTNPAAMNEALTRRPSPATTPSCQPFRRHCRVRRRDIASSKIRVHVRADIGPESAAGRRHEGAIEGDGLRVRLPFMSEEPSPCDPLPRQTRHAVRRGPSGRCASTSC